MVSKGHIIVLGLAVAVDEQLRFQLKDLVMEQLL
jgi:hypothetical protein